MFLPLSALLLLSFALAWGGTWGMKRVAPRIGFVDKPGGRKIHANPKPLGGGVAIFWAVALPLVVGLLYVNVSRPPRVGIFDVRIANVPAPSMEVTTLEVPAYWSGIRQQTPLALAIIGSAAALHVMGLFDDRKALGPYLKLLIQLGVTTALVVFCDLRILTALDKMLGMGRWPSVLTTILWITAITNAFNFLDNMDGLSAGVAAVCTTAFLIATVSIGQWFVAAGLALLLGALLGFLCFNFAPATIFMGDSGSLVIGFLLGVFTARTTYLTPGENWANHWYAVFAPVVVLALPLYDLVVVSAIRLSRGKSPFVGDTNHFSHRLVARGMSRRTAVLCLYLVSASTSIGAILLPHVTSHYALFILAQTVLILCLVMLLEQHPLPVGRDVGREQDVGGMTNDKIQMTNEGRVTSLK